MPTAPQGVKCILLDIEGTICPISFVKETLFPYALAALPEVLQAQWDSTAFRPYRDAFPESARVSPKELQAHVEDLTRRDVKVPALKNLQGYLWEDGYKTGAYATPLFADVVPCLRQWSRGGLKLAIYSSGSVFAQKLLFGHVRVEESGNSLKRKRAADRGDEEAVVANKALKAEGSEAHESLGEESGVVEAEPVARVKKIDAANASTPRNPRDPIATEDLTQLIADWFDTVNAGPKTEPASYVKICEALQFLPEDVLFLSDNVAEVDAASKAGMQSLLVDRPGNAAISKEDSDRLNVEGSLEHIRLPGDSPGGRQDQDDAGDDSSDQRRKR